MATSRRLLILAGTQEAAALATRAIALQGLEVISSLAGRTQHPRHPPGKCRLGGFGGSEGLTAYLQEQQIDLLIDATHPYAAQISWQAVAATARLGIPHLLFHRPPWEKTAGDQWIEVETPTEAAALLPGLAQRIFLSIGRQDLPQFAHLQEHWFLMRMVDPPQPGTSVPPGELLLQRGPFTLSEERSLLQRYALEAIVSKNSGGQSSFAKIRAARERGIPVVMLQRPPRPEVDQVGDLEGALQWLSARLSDLR